MQDLKDFTQDVHYENFRKKKLLEGSPAAIGMAPGVPGMETSPGGNAAQQMMLEKEKQVYNIANHVTCHMISLSPPFSSLRRCVDRWPCCKHSCSRPSTATPSDLVTSWII